VEQCGAVTSPEVVSPDMTSPEVASPKMTSPEVTGNNVTGNERGIISRVFLGISSIFPAKGKLAKIFYPSERIQY
jgi:hypothetical protein